MPLDYTSACSALLLLVLLLLPLHSTCRQHEADHAGLDSPGPACYDTAAAAAAVAGSVLGDRRVAHFGSGEREVSQKVKRSFAPGPGAYTGELVSTVPAASLKEA
jgi:hypothetical protein